MVLIRTIILKLILTICSASSLDVINLKIYNFQELPPFWLRENQPFYFDIESDIELLDMRCLYPINREFKGNLKHIFNITTNYVYSFSPDITVTEDMQGNWTCSVFSASTSSFWISKDFNVRVDVDECNASPSPCSSSANCTNTLGGYECTCLSEYSGNGTYCEGEASDGTHTWILVVIIVVVLIVVAAVACLIVDLHKRRQRREKANRSELMDGSSENTTERSMPPPAQWENYSIPFNRQNENATDTYSVPYQERNVEEMYAKPTPKSLRKLSKELLYAELSFTVEQKGENPAYGNFSNQTAEYSRIQIQPKILPTESPYSEVLPKSIRQNNKSSKYVNVFDFQRYVNSDDGNAIDRSEYAEPAYCAIGLKK